MSLFRRLFGNNSPEDEPRQIEPTSQRRSIYEHIQLHLVPDGPGLIEGGETLPDEDRSTRGQLRFAAGAMDGILTHHTQSQDRSEQVREVVRLLQAYGSRSTADNRAAVYQHVKEKEIVPIIDEVIESIVNDDQINQERLYELANSLARESVDREPVKFGIALLGLFPTPENEELFQTLGRHDEFTLYCAVALQNTSADAERSLWRLAQHVDGWGRIHVVERLAQTENAEVKAWLLRDGYRNSVMYEYLALTCATAGGLLEAISRHEVDRELLTSTGEIIGALIEATRLGGPVAGIDSYEDGAAVIENFLGHMERSAETLADFIHVRTIQQFLGEDALDWAALADHGWTDMRRNQLRVTCDQILRRSEWTERALAGLESQQEVDFQQASEVAEAVGIETWRFHWKRLQEKPEESGRWYQVMTRCDHERIGEVMAFAEASIPLEQIATGPADELGIGHEYKPHTCLDFVLRELHRFPGHGDAMIRAALRSPVVRNRNLAVAALAEWKRDRWSQSVRDALETAIEAEPNDDVRKRMSNVLAGRPMEDGIHNP